MEVRRSERNMRASRISCTLGARVEMRLLVLGAIAISLNACALQRGLTPETVASLKGRRLTTMVRRAPPFLPAIPGSPHSPPA